MDPLKYCGADERVCGDQPEEITLTVVHRCIVQCETNKI